MILRLQRDAIQLKKVLNTTFGIQSFRQIHNAMSLVSVFNQDSKVVYDNILSLKLSNIL